MTKGNAMTRTSTLLLILAGATAVSGCGTLGQLKTIGKAPRLSEMTAVDTPLTEESLGQARRADTSTSSTAAIARSTGRSAINRSFASRCASTGEDGDARNRANSMLAASAASRHSGSRVSSALAPAASAASSTSVIFSRPSARSPSTIGTSSGAIATKCGAAAPPSPPPECPPGFDPAAAALQDKAMASAPSQRAQDRGEGRRPNACIGSVSSFIAAPVRRRWNTVRHPTVRGFIPL